MHKADIKNKCISLALAGMFLLQTACGSAPGAVSTSSVKEQEKTKSSYAEEIKVCKDAESFAKKIDNDEDDYRLVMTGFQAPSEDKWEGTGYGGMTVMTYTSKTEAEAMADSMKQEGYAETAFVDEKTLQVQGGVYYASSKADPEENDYFRTKSKEGPVVVLIDTGVNGIETVDFTGECTADDNGHGTRMAQAIEKAAGGKADILSLKGLLESLPIAAAASHAAKSEAYFTDKSDFSEAKADYLDILNMVYPVGIYYRSAVNKSPAKFLGDMG